MRGTEGAESDRGERGSEGELVRLHVLPELLGDGRVGAAGAVPRQQLALRKVLRARTDPHPHSAHMQAGQHLLCCAPHSLQPT